MHRYGSPAAVRRRSSSCGLALLIALLVQPCNGIRIGEDDRPEASEAQPLQLEDADNDNVVPLKSSSSSLQEEESLESASEAAASVEEQEALEAAQRAAQEAADAAVAQGGSEEDAVRAAEEALWSLKGLAKSAVKGMAKVAKAAGKAAVKKLNSLIFKTTTLPPQPPAYGPPFPPPPPPPAASPCGGGGAMGDPDAEQLISAMKDAVRAAQAAARAANAAARMPPCGGGPGGGGPGGGGRGGPGAGGNQPCSAGAGASPPPPAPPPPPTREAQEKRLKDLASEAALMAINKAKAGLASLR
eukprot:TRINITY_DN20523_c0_g1_i1.p1 TRINITY_DN20523_c0_g1~~TRINITY_DN20523_c0_g1_i1.p1  ORF type:complete len:301 (-),score=109.57 TRINITY_DN20523_c0_g1_i1:62-964(-)